MVFHWILRDCNSPQVSRTVLSILVDLNNAVVWMISTRPVISKCSCPCINPLVTVLWALIIIGITITFMFHSFFDFQATTRYLSLFVFFQFYSVVSRDSKGGVMVKAMDCGIVVREFELQSRYYVHFRANTLGKGMNPLILPAMG